MELSGMYANTTDRANSPVGTWTQYTKNIVIGKDNKSILNEDGFSLYIANPPVNQIPIGDLPTRNDEFMVWSVGTSSEIGIVNDSGVYRTIIKDPAFGFDADFPIVGKHRYNYKGEMEVVFHDKKNDIYFINVDNVQAPLNADFTLVNPEDINKFKLFPRVQVPEFKLNAVAETGGSLKKGAYWITIAYEDATGSITNCTPLSGAIFVSANFNKDFTHTDGGLPKDNTTKAIIMELKNIDRRFKKAHIYVIAKRQGIVEAFKVKEVNINNTDVSFTYTGNEEHITVPIGEVIVDRPSIRKVDEIETDNDILYLAGIEGKVKTNYQRYINNFKVRYITDKVELAKLPGSFKDSLTIYFKRPLLHDEVYGLYVTPVMTDGSYGGGFHIPGRAPREIQETWNVQDLMENDTVISAYAQAGQNAMLEDDKISPGRVKYFHTRDTSSADGTLGYWENQNETYPDTDDSDIYDSTGKIGTLRNQKVRHHKMPSIARHGYFNQDDLTAPILGIEISNIYLPNWDEVQYLEVFYAKRTAYNSTLLGQSLLFFSSTDLDNNPNKIDTSSGNIRLNKVNTDKRKELRGDYIRFHSFDMLLDKPGVMPTHLINQVKIKTKIEIEWNEASSSIIYNVNVNEKDRTVIEAVPDDLKVRALVEQQYIPFDTIVSDNNTNQYAEEVFFARLQTPGLMGIQMANMAEAPNPYTANQTMETFLTNMYSWKEDVYNNLDEQELVSTGIRLHQGDTTKSGFGGDGFISPYGILTSARSFTTDEDIFSAPDGKTRDGLKGKYFFYSESANNIGLRYGDYYNKSEEILNNNLELKALATEYPINYNKDYTSINNLNPAFVFDPDNVQTNFYNRIYRSRKANREERVSSWRIFLPNDYYEATKNRGRIINLSAVKGELLIQHEYGLFTTLGKDTLKTEGALIQVGSGDIFAREPREILDTENGYVGTQNRLGCFKFKGGYISVDAKQGRIFIIDDKLDEVSSRGISDILQEDMKFTLSNDDNTYTKNGITIGYDDKNKRILLTKKEVGGKSFTISFHVANKYWIAYHDYVPNRYITTANKLISIKDGFFLHNTPNKKGRYYGETVYPSVFEPVSVNQVDKSVLSVAFKTQITEGRGLRLNDTIDWIMLYNDYQCSGILGVLPIKNVRWAQGMWRFNAFKDIAVSSVLPFLNNDGSVIDSNINRNMPFYKKKIFTGKYLCIRFIFDNLFTAQELTLSDYFVNDNINYR